MSISKNLNLPLALELAKTNLQAKYAGSIFGFLWSILHPLILFLTYLFAFKIILRIPWTHQDIGAFCLVIFFWHWLAQSLTESTSLVLGNKHLLSKVPVKLETLAIAAVLSNFAQFFIANILCILVISVTLGLTFNPILYFLAISLTLFLVIHFYTVLGSLNVFFRDIQHLVANFLTPIFLLTPAIYDLKDIPKEALPIVWLNPLTSFVTIFKAAFKEIELHYLILSVSLAIGWIALMFLLHKVIQAKMLKQLLDAL
jgi:lipopolysaccharide transport system permease protein